MPTLAAQVHTRQFSMRTPGRLAGLPRGRGSALVSHKQRGKRRRACRALPPLAAASSTAAAGSTAELKQALLLAISRSNNPQPGDSLLDLEQAVEAAAERLAAANPTPAAAASPLINGSWALLYSGRSRRLAASAAFPSSAAAGPSLQEALQAASDGLYSTFYQYLPVLAGSAVGARRGGGTASNLQVISPGRVDNVVTTRGPLPLRLCVSGSVETVPPPAGRPASCVAVRFDRFTARAGPLPEAAVSLAWLSPLGYVDTCFLDEDTRVSVGDKGGLFVLRRVPDGEEGAAGKAQAAGAARAAGAAARGGLR